MATDAANRAIRRVSLLSLISRDVDVLGLPSSSTKVSTWSRRSVCKFTRGILAVANNFKLVAAAATSRAFYTWRLIVSLETSGTEAVAAVVAVAGIKEGQGSGKEKMVAAVMRLNALFLHEVAGNEKVHKDLWEARKQTDSNDAFTRRIPLTYAKRFIIMQMSARVKRCMRHGFDKWKFFLQNAHERMRLQSLELELLLGQQSIRSCKGKIKEMQKMNKNLSQLMARAKSFYFWKALTVNDILDENKSAALMDQSAIFHNLREVKNSILATKVDESQHVENYTRFGDEIMLSLEKLKDGVEKVCALALRKT